MSDNETKVPEQAGAQIKKKEPKGPDTIAPAYRLKGGIIYTGLVVIFVIFAILFVVFKYHQRANPPISVESVIESFAIPTFYICVPGVVAYHSFSCETDEDIGANADCDAWVINDGEGDTVSPCVEIEYTDSFLENVPAEVVLEVVYTGTYEGFLENELTFGEDLTRVYYIGPGTRNSRSGIVNNLVAKRVVRTFLNEPNSEEWEVNVFPTPALWVTENEGHEDLTCDSDVEEFCVATVGEDCGDTPVEGAECAFVQVIYLQFQTRATQYIREKDPVNWGEIMGTLGGYWVYVGALFGVLFAYRLGENFDGHLYPSKIGQKILGGAEEDETVM